MLIYLVSNSFEVSVVVGFDKEVEDVYSRLPVDFESVARFIVNVSLGKGERKRSVQAGRFMEKHETHLGRKHTHVDPLLNSELANEHIESGVQNSNNGSRTNDGTITSREIVDEDTEEEVCGLFLGESSGVFLDVADLSNLCDGFSIHTESFGALIKGGTV